MVRTDRIHLNPEIEKRRQEQFEKLRKDPQIIEFLKAAHKDEAFLQAYMGDFLQEMERRKICKNCQGLVCCRMEIRGMCKTLHVDEEGYLTDSYRPCRYQKVDEADKAHLKRIWINNIDPELNLLNMSHIGKQMASETEEYNNVFADCMKVQMQPGFGVFLYGQPGTGKTYLLSALANTLAISGKSVCFVRMPLLIQDMKMNFSDDGYRRKVMRQLMQCDVLFLDDLGSEAISAWSRDEILFPLLDDRMSHHRSTCFASNYSLKELQSQYADTTGSRIQNGKVASARLIDRIRSMSKPEELVGDSRRVSLY